jgi:WD40 repeat protein
MDGLMSRIFLSHSSVDNRAAVALRAWLVEQRPELADEIFLDIDPGSGLQVGARWKGQLFESNSRCEAVICLLSQAWTDSHECRAEYRTAEGLGKQILVARLQDTGDSDITSEWQRCDLFAPGPQTAVAIDGGDPVAFNSAALYALRKAIEGTGIGPEHFVWPPKDFPLRAPYRGWEPFEDIDAGVFFGRDAAIVRGLDELRAMRMSGLKSLFVVLGPSGSGKSSFLRAGLIPRLQREDRRFAVLGIMRPERAALSGKQGFAAAVHGGAVRVGLTTLALGEVKSACVKGAAAVVEVLNTIRARAAARLVDAGHEGPAPTLVVPLDQAEELFSADAGVQAEQFLGLIAAVLAQINTSETALIVAATIRTDRYEVMQNHPALDGIGSVLFDELKPMPPTQFERVITGPAGRTGRVRMAPDLVGRLIADAGEGADTLPLLALTLARLYGDYASTGELTLANYEAMGGMHQVVQTAVDEVLAGEPTRRGEQLAVLRSAFIPWLATINPDNDQPMRRVARQADLPAAGLALIDALVDKRLLVRDERGGHVVIEVALESLLRQWDELAGWLREERGHLKAADDIERSATAWATHDRDPAWLLTGTRLIEAETLADAAGFSERLADARAYLGACRHAENQRLAAEEEQRQAQLRFAQERQQTAETHAATLRKRSRILQAVLVGTALIAVIAVVGFTQATTQRHQAQTRFRQAIAQRLNSEAADMLAGTTAGGDARAFQELLAARTLATPDNGALLHAAAIRSTTAKIIDTNAMLHGLAYSPTTHHIASGGSDNWVRLWNADTGQPIGQPLKGHTGTVNAVAFSADGHRLASASDDHSVRLWNADTGQPLRTLIGHTGAITGVAFSPDGRLLVSGGDHTIRLWDVATGKPRGEPLTGEMKSVFSVAFSPDGHRLASGSDDANVRLWDVETGQPIGEPMTGHSIAVTSVAFSSDGRFLASGSGDAAVRLWNPVTGQQVGGPLPGHTQLVWKVAFSPDGRHLASGGDDQTLRVWDLSQVSTAGGSSVVDVKYSPDAHRLAGGVSDGTVWLWNADSGRAIGQPLTGHDGSVNRVAFSPDGHRLASASADRTVRLWNADTAQPLQVLTGHTGAVFGVAFSPTGRTLASGGEDGKVLLWDADTGRLLAVLMDREGESAESVAFSQDGRLLAIADSDGTVRIRDTATHQPTVSPMTGNGEPIFDVAFSPDGRRLVSSGSDDALRLWHPDTGKPIGAPLTGHTDIVEGVAYSPDGRLIVSGSRDQTVRLWDAETGAPVSAPFNAASGWINHVAFGPDSRHVASADLDGTVRQWPTSATPEMLCAKLTTNMSHKQWHDWISPHIGYATLCPDLPIASD